MDRAHLSSGWVGYCGLPVRTASGECTGYFKYLPRHAALLHQNRADWIQFPRLSDLVAIDVEGASAGNAGDLRGCDHLKGIADKSLEHVQQIANSVSRCERFLQDSRVAEYLATCTDDICQDAAPFTVLHFSMPPVMRALVSLQSFLGECMTRLGDLRDLMVQAVQFSESIVQRIEDAIEDSRGRTWGGVRGGLEGRGRRISCKPCFPAMVLV